MLLAIDIGNTSIRLGVFNRGRLSYAWSVSTRQKSYYAAVKKAIRRYHIERVVICSVVPASLRQLRADLKVIPGRPEVLIIGKQIKVPLKNRYRYPAEVGQDRLVNAFAGLASYGKPLIVVDSGTAITFDVVSRKGEYLGGVILPGLELSFDSLYNKTALLPRLKLRAPRELIGRDTKESILSGVVHGFAAAIDELVNRIKKQIGSDAVVVATGGGARLMRRYCKKISKVDKDLTLKGISLLERL